MNTGQEFQNEGADVSFGVLFVACSIFLVEKHSENIRTFYHINSQKNNSTIVSEKLVKKVGFRCLSLYRVFGRGPT